MSDKLEKFETFKDICKAVYFYVKNDIELSERYQGSVSNSVRLTDKQAELAFICGVPIGMVDPGEQENRYTLIRNMGDVEEMRNENPDCQVIIRPYIFGQAELRDFLNMAGALEVSPQELTEWKTLDALPATGPEKEPELYLSPEDLREINELKQSPYWREDETPDPREAAAGFNNDVRLAAVRERYGEKSYEYETIKQEMGLSVEEYAGLLTRLEAVMNERGYSLEDTKHTPQDFLNDYLDEVDFHPVADDAVKIADYIAERNTGKSKTQPVKPITLESGTSAGRLKEITAKLEQGVKDVFTSENYADYLKTMGKFHNYSPRNSLLIFMQNPGASLVAGYQAWQSKFGRYVKKGETGIKIVSPSPYKKKIEVPVTGKDGSQRTEEKEITVPGFKVSTVFDVSQTDGKPLPEIETHTLTGSVKSYDAFMEALKKTSPYPIGFENIQSSANGYFHQTEKRIALQEGMSQAQTLKTCVHEVAHAMIHDIDLKSPAAGADGQQSTPRPDRRTREVEAESIAYVVCSHYGLDTSSYSFGYIAGWSRDKDAGVLQSSLDTIQSAAGSIIHSIDDRMKDLQAELNTVSIIKSQAQAEYNKMTSSRNGNGSIKAAPMTRSGRGESIFDKIAKIEARSSASHPTPRSGRINNTHELAM